MTTPELKERIDAWCHIHSNDCDNLTPSDSPRVEAMRRKLTKRWNAGLLVQAAQLEMTPDLAGTPTGAMLQDAIDMAARGMVQNLDLVHSYLSAVQKALEAAKVAGRPA